VGHRGPPLPPAKYRRPSKIVPNSNRLWKLLKIAEFRTPTPQDVRKKGSIALKLPPVRNCFTLAMANKLVVITNSLKVTKIMKILLYEMKFLLPNYSCLHNPWLGGYRPQIPVLSVLNWICWTPPPNKIPGYATAQTHVWLRTDCIWITAATKQHCIETFLHKVLTGNISVGHRSGGEWNDTWHWTERWIVVFWNTKQQQQPQLLPHFLPNRIPRRGLYCKYNNYTVH
jgi:hypothetical protein